MKRKGVGSKKAATIVVAIAIVFIGLMINWGKSQMDSAIVDTTIGEMQQVGTQMNILLVDTLQEGRSSLALLADYVAEYGVTESNAVEFFALQSQSEEFETLYYVDLKGNGISREGKVHDFSGNEAYMFALTEQFLVTSPHVSVTTNEMTFDIAVPVMVDDEVTAVLFSEVPLKNIFDVMDDSLSEMGDMFIVDHNLNLVFSSSEKHAGSTVIPESDVVEMGIENVTQAQHDIIAGRDGGFYYNYHGVPKIMVYTAIEMTDWALALNVELEQFSSALTTAIVQFEGISSIVYWTVVLLVAYISFSQARASKKLIKTAYYDPLTDMPNLAKLKLEMAEVLERDRQTAYSIVVFDIENFKAINEMFGFEVGDRVLKAIKPFADSFGDQISIAARLGGDEFAMFGARSFFDEMEVVVSAVPEFFDAIVPELTEYAASFTIGRYSIEPGETDVEDIMTKVNLAHTSAKNSKNVLVCDYDESFRKKIMVEAEITNKMKAAIDNKEFKVYLQPKFSTYEDKLVGAEALVRWIEADGNMIYPNDFIPLFEKNGFIVELDRYVLETVCQTLKKWMDDGMGHITISINCSRLNLENPFFVDGVVAIADKYGVPHECIEIELTESTTFSNEDMIVELFTDLRNNNFRISIDDFGAGYSSLGMLKNLHVDTLKMDRSFFVGGKNARRDDMLIDSIVKMSHNLGMYVVAEGIETPEQVELLRSMNCDAVQGYVFDKPMPIPDFEAKYRNDIQSYNTADDSDMSVIYNINDAKFANTFVPCGLLIAEMDEHFTIVEANDYYFEMIGYTREEVRDKFKNQGLMIMNPESKNYLLKYLAERAETDPYGQMEYTSTFTTKSGSNNSFRLVGRIAASEHGRNRIYLSVTDITDLVEVHNQLEKEKYFVSDIASLTGSDFYDFDVAAGAIRFSEDFARRFGIPEVVENFLDSELGQTMFPTCVAVLRNANQATERFEGEFCVTLSNGEVVWYTYSCQTIYDNRQNRYRTIGKMSEVTGHKIEMDILKQKSEADALNRVYDKQATERYIKNYLRTATSKETGALFVVELSDFGRISEVAGEQFGQECLQDVGSILRNTFRSTDIIGRVDNSRFYVFINDYKSIAFVERKASELCALLRKTYNDGENSVDISASIGVSLYPEHGDSFEKVYEKADKALKLVGADGKTGFSLYKDA